MRPVRLTMQAFGPYAGREVVDFRAAVAAGLFGIYGQTGAGKSTIFSAMTFALFGEAARTDQDTASLRSDHADPAVPTEVEFVFAIGERTYVVRRRPEQIRPKQRGSGETRGLHEAWLFDATGLALEDIGEGTSGKVLVERQTGRVRDAVGELLGYGPAQFRQIVLLPQGRFEAFLAAKTDERVKILRDLFDVSMYRRLAHKLHEDAKAVEREVRDARLVHSSRLGDAGFETMDALGDAVDATAGMLADARAREAEAGAAVGEAIKAREAAERGTERFAAAEAADRALAALEARTAEIATVEARLEGARRARTLCDVEDHRTAAADDAAKAQVARTEADALAVEAATRAEAAGARLAAEHERAPETLRLDREVQTLDAHRRTLGGAASLERVAREADAALVGAAGEWQRATDAHAQLVSTIAQAEAAVTAARNDGEARGTFARRRTELEAARASAEAFSKARRDAADAQAKAERCVADDAEAARRLDEARAALERVEADIAAAQAAHLAADLVDGAPCPVCGSCCHPAPASTAVVRDGLTARRRDARKELDAADAARQLSGRALATAAATLEARHERLAELDAPAVDAAELGRALATLAGEVEALGPALDFAAAQAHWRTLADRREACETAREAARGRHDLAKEASAVAAAKLAQALSTIPAPLRAGDTLAAALEATRAALEARRGALRDAEAAERAAREALIGAQKDAEAAAASLATAQQRLAGARETFARRLAENGLSESAYRAHKAAIATIEADQAMVENHRQAVAMARDAADRARAAIAGCERPDLAAFQAAEAAAQETLRLAAEARILKDKECQQLRALFASLTEAARAIEGREAATAPLRNLARLFNADNAHKLDLETFAIGAMFEEVLRAANQRLQPMTGGRYTLLREAEVGAGRARSGLGILAFDIHTGKARPTATLSGGETFIAALALALGLSDVVERASGKVRLDTIFIDEGFGSLDTEDEAGTLEQVLRVLQDMDGRSRAIGVISHVPLVQDAIPNGFQIRPQETGGSRIEVRAA